MKDLSAVRLKGKALTEKSQSALRLCISASHPSRDVHFREKSLKCTVEFVRYAEGQEMADIRKRCLHRAREILLKLFRKLCGNDAVPLTSQEEHRAIVFVQARTDVELVDQHGAADQRPGRGFHAVVTEKADALRVDPVKMSTVRKA